MFVFVFCSYFLSSGISECFKQKKVLDEVRLPVGSLNLRAGDFLLLLWVSRCWIKAAWWISPCGSLGYLINYLSSICLNNPCIFFWCNASMILCQVLFNIPINFKLFLHHSHSFISIFCASHSVGRDGLKTIINKLCQTEECAVYHLEPFVPWNKSNNGNCLSVVLLSDESE